MFTARSKKSKKKEKKGKKTRFGHKLHFYPCRQFQICTNRQNHPSFYSATSPLYLLNLVLGCRRRFFAVVAFVVVLVVDDVVQFIFLIIHARLSNTTASFVMQRSSNWCASFATKQKKMLWIAHSCLSGKRQTEKGKDKQARHNNTK